MRDDLKELYRNRFSEIEEKKKNNIWICICRYLQRFVNKNISGRICVDVAAGYCDFINNIILPEKIKKSAYDANPDITHYAADNVKTIVDDICNISQYYEDGSVSLFFLSNFLEHIEKDKIKALFLDMYNLLSDDGEIWILTPNIKYVGGKYWDFFDHITPITDNSIIELAESMGYTRKKIIKKFLPFTTKSILPQWPWLVSIYLKLMPLSGLFFGEQSFIILKKG